MVAPRRLESILIDLRSFEWSIIFFVINALAIIISRFFTPTPPFTKELIQKEDKVYINF